MRIYRIVHLFASFLSVTLLMLLLVGCEREDIVSPELDLVKSEDLAHLSRTSGHDAAAIPIKGRFYTDRVALLQAPDRCGPFEPENGQYNLLNRQAGSGHLRGVGPVEVTYEFCVDVADRFDANPAVLDTGIPYWGTGTFTARNGDQIFSTANGIVLQSDDPAYDFEFHDTQTITGGTGRFAGASGSYTFDSVVDDDYTLEDGTVVSRTFHRITGHVTLAAMDDDDDHDGDDDHGEEERRHRGDEDDE